MGVRTIIRSLPWVGGALNDPAFQGPRGLSDILVPFMDALPDSVAWDAWNADIYTSIPDVHTRDLAQVPDRTLWIVKEVEVETTGATNLTLCRLQLVFPDSSTVIECHYSGTLALLNLPYCPLNSIPGRLIVVPPRFRFRIYAGYAAGYQFTSKVIYLSVPIGQRIPT